MNRRAQVRWGIAAAIALLVGAVVWLLWSGVLSGQQQLQYRTVQVDIVSSTELRVTLQVTNLSETPTRCSVMAVSPAQAPVGYKVVDLPTDEFRTQVLSTTLYTTEPALNAMVHDCWVPNSAPMA